MLILDTYSQALCKTIVDECIGSRTLISFCMVEPLLWLILTIQLNEFSYVCLHLHVCLRASVHACVCASVRRCICECGRAGVCMYVQIICMQMNAYILICNYARCMSTHIFPNTNMYQELSPCESPTPNWRAIRWPEPTQTMMKTRPKAKLALALCVFDCPWVPRALLVESIDPVPPREATAQNIRLHLGPTTVQASVH